ncbi:hypothetical protein JP0077_15780 [Helicobacter pylori]|nr:hypothetical protein JP0077_15780 [Helicobacter pylori]
MNFEVSFQLKTKYPNNELKIALIHRLIHKMMTKVGLELKIHSRRF